MNDDSIHVLKTVKYIAIAVGGMMLAGILTVMFLARGKSGDDGDIAGVVAPALLVAFVSGVIAAFRLSGRGARSGRRTISIRETLGRLKSGRAILAWEHPE